MPCCEDIDSNMFSAGWETGGPEVRSSWIWITQLQTPGDYGPQPSVFGQCILSRIYAALLVHPSPINKRLFVSC